MSQKTSPNIGNWWYKYNISKTCLVCLISLFVILPLKGADTPAQIFWQAEGMTVSDTTAWKVVEHFPYWYKGVPLEKMLRGSKGGAGKAVQEVNVPAAGTWRLWVRYLEAQREENRRGPFRVTVLQGGQTKGEKVFDKKLKKKSYIFQKFVWGWLDIPLAAGPVQVVLSKEDPLKVSWLTRHVDCFALTDDTTYVPKESDFVAPLWVKVRMGEKHPRPSSIHIFGRRPLRVPPAYIAHHQLDGLGLVPRYWPRAGYLLSPGNASPWVNIAPLLGMRGLNTIRFMAMLKYPDGIEGADFELLFADEPSDKAVIKRFHRSGSGSGLLVTVDLTKRDEIRSEVEWSEEALEWARAIPTPVGRRAVRMPLLTRLAVRYAVNTSQAVSNEHEVMTLLGFSGLRALKAELDQGFVNPFISSYYFSKTKGCLSQPKHEAIVKQVNGTLQWGLESAAAKDIAYIDLMDEPSSVSLAHMEECAACAEGLRTFLRDRAKLTPKFFGRDSWDKVMPTTDKKDARLYYWTARFRHQVLADFFKIGTNALRKTIPDIRTTSNYSPRLTYEGNMLRDGVDPFLIQGQEALTYGWTEDWCNYATTYQTCGYEIDFLRASCRAQGQDFGAYTILGGRYPWDIQAKTVGKIGHGVKAIYHFNYGPVYAISSDQNSQRPDVYPALAKVNHAIGAVEDYIMDGHVPAGRVALLYSHSSDIWTQEDSSSVHGKERQAIWLLLRHLGCAPEIITEDEVKSGCLSDYDLVFMQGAQLNANAATNLAAWVKKGGTLYLGAGSAQFDQYNQPMDFDGQLGIERGTFTLSQAPGAPEINRYSRLSLLAKANMGNETLEAVCGLQELSLWEGAQAQLSFEDGKAAMVVGPAGSGRVIATGFFPGIGYARGGVAARAKRDAKITHNPPSFPAGYRTLLSKVLGDALKPAPATTSNYLVEAGLLESPHGLLITLANWTGRPVTNLEVRVRGAGGQGKPTALLSPIKSALQKDGELVLTLDVAEFEFITIPKENAK